MTHSPQLVTSLAHSNTLQIAVSDSVQLSVLGSGFVPLTGGCFQDVLLVLDILMNLLSVYRIFHSSSSKIVEFSPHDVVIRELHDPDLIVATSNVDLDF